MHKVLPFYKYFSVSCVSKGLLVAIEKDVFSHAIYTNLKFS